MGFIPSARTDLVEKRCLYHSNIAVANGLTSFCTLHLRCVRLFSLFLVESLGADDRKTDAYQGIDRIDKKRHLFESARRYHIDVKRNACDAADKLEHCVFDKRKHSHKGGEYTQHRGGGVKNCKIRARQS